MEMTFFFGIGCPQGNPNDIPIPSKIHDLCLAEVRHQLITAAGSKVEDHQPWFQLGQERPGLVFPGAVGAVIRTLSGGHKSPRSRRSHKGLRNHTSPLDAVMNATVNRYSSRKKVCSLFVSHTISWLQRSLGRINFIPCIRG